ncbi:MAG: glycosyltransferase [Betaproteobacteria bacterium]|nr:glycosyltransferase [Betaproteobacteria bacterium]
MPSPPPAVSVVIPTYNHAQFLGQALRSVLAQTCAGWEAIVVNNYSQDNTAEIVAAFDDPRIQLVNFRNHGIIAASRNHGVQLARAELVAFLDSDDVWYPRKLECCLARLEEGYDLVCHGEAWTTDGAPARNMFYGPEARAAYRSLLFNGNCISTSAVVVKKTVLRQAGGFNEDARFVTVEDYDLWLRLSRAGARIGFVREILGEYRIHGANASKALLRHLEAEIAVIESHFAALAALDWITRLRIRRRRALAYYGTARGFQTAGDYREAWRWFARAYRESPFILRMHAAVLLNLLAPLRRAFA